MSDKNLAPDGSPYQWGAHPPGLRPEEPEAPPPVATATATVMVVEPTAVAGEVDESKVEEKAAAAEPHRASYRTRRAKPADED